MGSKLAVLALFAVILAGCSAGEDEAPVPKATTPPPTKPQADDPSPLPEGLKRNVPGG